MAEEATVHLNFNESDQLLPETNTNETGPYPSRLVEAEYTGVGPIRENKQWVEIGSWSSGSRATNITMTPENVNFWYSIIQEDFDAEPELRMTMFIDGDQRYQDTYDLIDGDDGEIRETLANFTEMIFRINHDVPFEIYLEYSGYEDLVFWYDHQIHDSGMFLVSDVMSTGDMWAGDDIISLEVGDIFASNWDNVSYFLVVSVNDKLVERDNYTITTEPSGSIEVEGRLINMTEINWDLVQSLQDRDEVEVWVKYTNVTDQENRGIRRTFTTGKERPIASISSVAPNPATTDDDITFDGSDSSDEDGSIERYLWESDLDGTLYDGPDSSFTTTGLSLGDHSISLRVQDNDDLWCDAPDTHDLEIVDQVNAAPSVELTSPDNESIIQETTVTLEWEGTDDDGDELTYDLYIGTEASADTLEAEELSDEEFDLQDLEDGATYWWKIVVSDGSEEVESDERTFTIELPQNAPPTISLDSPEDGAVISFSTATLSWTADDEDGDDLTFSVYFNVGYPADTLFEDDLDRLWTDVDDLQDRQLYSWQVAVYDGEDRIWSETRNLTVDLDSGDGNTDPEITLLAPIYSAILKQNEVTLSWRGEDDDRDDDLTYTVFMGLEQSNLQSVATDISQTYYQPIALETGTTYYWKVEISDGTSVVSSDIWTFFVEEEEPKEDEESVIPGFSIVPITSALIFALLIQFRKRELR